MIHILVLNLTLTHARELFLMGTSGWSPQIPINPMNNILLENSPHKVKKKKKKNMATHTHKHNFSTPLYIFQFSRSVTYLQSHKLSPDKDGKSQPLES